MSERSLELSRHHWEQGMRSLARLQAGSRDAALTQRQLGVIGAELSRRVGRVFTLAELARVYTAADRWSLVLLSEALPAESLEHAANVVDAAFGLYARGASDYRP